MIDYCIHYGLTEFYIFICYLAYNKRDLIPKIDNNIIKNVSIVHNINLIVLNTYVFLTTCYAFYDKQMLFYGNDPNDQTNLILNNTMYLFWISKYYDYIDTIIIILNNNFRQLSYLHVFHHSTVSSILFFSYKFTPYCGDMWFPMMFNSFIHILLYYYYLLSITNDKQKIWWAKYLTRLQLIQFICIIAQQYLSITTDKIYPYYVREVHILYGFYMIYLFGQFYIKKYNIKKIED